jgi:hypothetical protein
VHPGERLDARIRPDLGEGMIINPRHDRLSVDSELDHAGVVKCDFGEHSAAGASLDQHTPVQLNVVGELDDCGGVMARLRCPVCPVQLLAATLQPGMTCRRGLVANFGRGFRSSLAIFTS